MAFLWLYMVVSYVCRDSKYSNDLIVGQGAWKLHHESLEIRLLNNKHQASLKGHIDINTSITSPEKSPRRLPASTFRSPNVGTRGAYLNVDFQI